MTTSQSTPTTASLIAEGHAQFRAGRLREAEQTYHQTLVLDPGHPEALAFLGMIAGQAGHLQDAVKLFERALKRAPRNADIHHNLGETWRHLGDTAKALECFERAAACNPDHIEAYRNGAAAALAEVRRREAAGRWGDAATLKVTAAGLLVRAGQRLLNAGERTGAIDALRRASELAPNSADVWAWYGSSLIKPSPSKAIPALQRSIALDPAIAWVHGALGDAFAYLRHDAEAAAAWQAAGAADPSYYDRQRWLSLCELLPLYAGGDPATMFARHRAWGQAVLQRRQAQPQPFKNVRDPDRPLRIGYVSADYRTHSVAYFLEPLLATRDPAKFEIACYSAMPAAREDAVTARIKAAATLWRNVAALDDPALRRQVRADRIDILIDLSGHFEGSRLSAFAVKPAPVTATWLGYPATTGLATMDWRITDAIADPSGAEVFHTEKLMRLDGGFLCYGPPTNAPDVVLRPALDKGQVTFGSFNNQMKLNAEVIETWSRLLKSAPSARLHVKSEQLDDEGVASRIRSGFAAEGIDLSRIVLRPWIAETRDHLAAYGEVDIALDPFPYNGTTTTCEALWMGVPVVTLVGDRHSARVGLDLLTRVGLERLAAPDIDSYVRVAADLARDSGALATLRTGLRERVARSPLCDAARFAHEFETALRAAWRQWCELDA
jgi:protein O-GlcNAc transferase